MSKSLTGLGAKVAALLFAVILFVGIAGLAAFYLLSSRQAIQNLRQDSKLVNGAFQSFIADRAAFLDTTVGYGAGSAQIAGLVGTDDRMTVQAEMGPIRKKLDLDAVEVFDADSKLLGEDGFRTLPSQSGSKNLARMIIEKGSWGGVLDQDGDLMIGAGRSIVIAGYPKGAMCGFIRLSVAQLGEIAREVPDSGLAILYRGQVTASYGMAVGAKLRADNAPYQISVGGKDYTAMYADLPGTNPGDQMGVVTLRSVDETWKSTRQYMAVFLAILLIACLFALLIGGAAVRNLTSPIDRLVESARTIQNGSWPKPFQSQRRDQLGVLMEVFDEMSASVQSNQAKLLAMVDTDPLTELANHRRFKERLDQECIRAAQASESIAVTLIDIDDFRTLNDRLGHAMGDRLIRLMADEIGGLIPEIALAGRYGPDQFAILSPRSDFADADQLVERLRFAIRRNSRDVEFSAGIVAAVPSEDAGASILLGTEIALARAKQLGGRRTAQFDLLMETQMGADARELYRGIRDPSFATIQALAAAVDAKDSYTLGHSERVAAYARDLAVYMGLSAEEVDLVFRSGRLHDVGKIGVPDSILNKPGRLDDDERRIIESHPVLGEVIVRKVPQLDELLPGVRNHHERWDGRGYPDRLAGHDIPWVARYLAVADTFDAMTSDRPYRKGMPVVAALEEIEKSSGIQFEPKLATGFVAMMRSRYEAAA